MKKFLLIIFLFLSFNIPTAKGLENPGDVMIDFESFSAENCDFQCFDKLDKNYNWPKFPEIFSSEWLDENLLRQGKKYFDMKDWIYETPKIINAISRACLIGETEACNAIITNTEKIIKDDFLKPTDWSSWPHDYKKIKSSEAVFLFEKYFAGPMIEAYAIALKAENKSVHPDFKEWFYRRYEPNLKYYTHTQKNWKYERIKKFNLFKKKVPQNHLIEITNMHLAALSLLNDKDAFEKELELWDLYLITMTKKGALPLEAQRGAHAIGYTAKSIMGLMKMAHIAEIQGFNLWDRKYEKEYQNLHYAIEFLIDTLANNKLIWIYAKTNDSAGKTKYKKTYSKNFPTELSFYYFYKEKFPDHPNITKLENLIFDKRMCKVSAKQRMKYCASDNDEIKFKDIIKNDSKNLKKHNSFMGERCFYFTGKYKPEIRNNFVVVIKNKKDEKYLFKTKGPSKKITIKKGMKDCESKHSEGCYVHYSSRIAFGS